MEGQPPEPLAQPTRARLFARIREAGGEATTEELARALDLHVNGVRRHLGVMGRAGLLERRRLKQGRGRPRDLWRIAPEAAGADRPSEDYVDVARWLARALSGSEADLIRVEETGRQVGRELPVAEGASVSDGLAGAFAELGFQPAVSGEGGVVRCELTNCPYRASVRESPEVVCRLHRGITEGLLEQLEPGATLTLFEPHDPDEAGCLVEVVEAGV